MPNTDHMKCKMYSVKEVQEMLGLPKTTTYTFIKRVYEEQYPFAVVKVGRFYMIPKTSFNLWLEEFEDE